MTTTVLKHYMVQDDNPEIIQWILSTGVNINERPDHQRSLKLMTGGYFDPMTPLQRAVWKGDISLIQDFIDYGADVDDSSSGGGNALLIAAHAGYFGIVQRLLELGADPNASHTVIETAAERGRLDIVQLLINYGVETSGRGRRQFVRSVALAEREGHHAIVRLLKSHAGWTEADEDLLRQKNVALNYPSERDDVPAYVRRYYGELWSDWGDWRFTALEDPPLDEVGSNTEECQSSDKLNSDSEEYASSSEEISQAPAEESLSRDVDISETWPASEDTFGRVQEPAEELDEPSEMSPSTFDPVSNLPDAYETLSEEVGMEFLPSSMSYQIREELEGGGSLEESGDDLWAEEYGRFITELV
ncbi:hypothetical protein K4K49_009879 [Colletotrichum sp. SAR 10_70]|nr:hypothetical protein K4K50_011504 [Colletotrichum sp. SAR 10_71]KAI8202847.1 hypothetical protein K4K49_009879 [Colletotrichum sp. SAR 10_70]KAI8206577.1 hypothetical protein KHU50_012879 [Colletotrichum sp. SAR 10_65]KAI8214878.1 hypothetical protein K4K52_012440 [Colletotrichum sp. SAR 10_76]KAJ5007815.1 hypothetical protein K4K48_010952 [Colletotrichum sp. SAR 10_66]